MSASRYCAIFRKRFLFLRQLFGMQDGIHQDFAWNEEINHIKSYMDDAAQNVANYGRAS